MKLSIIIPVYNVEKYLRDCLESVALACLDYPNETEIIIVDDGSTDSSPLIIDRFADEHSNFVVIHKNNEGVAKARNDGLATASGEYVWFVDSDDMIEKESITLIRNQLLRTETDLLIFDATEFNARNERAWKHSELKNVIDEDNSYNELIAAETLYYPINNANVPLAAPWDKIIRKDFLTDKGILFDPNLKVLDDMTFVFELFQANPRYTYIDYPIYLYRRVSTSITNKYYENRVEEDRKVWSKLRKITETGDDRTENLFIWQAYYLRIIKSFSICCRLSFFNKQNKNRLKDKLKNVKSVLELPEYKEAFCCVNKSYAEWKLKVVIFFVRRKFVFGIYLLHLLENVL